MDSTTPPPKPWEINREQTPTSNNYGNLRSSSDSIERKAPPVPLRPAQQVCLYFKPFSKVIRCTNAE